MGQIIPVGPWPEFETTQACGSNTLRAAADKSGKMVTESAVVRRTDGLWQVEGQFHQGHDLAQERTYVIAGGG